MPCEFICDGCGKRKAGWANRIGDWHKPSEWYQRTDEEGKTHVACSYKCVEQCNSVHADPKPVIPI